MRPNNLKNAAIFDKATEILQELMHSDNPDKLGEAMEAAASDSDLAEAVIFRLTVVARGWADENNQDTGVEMVAKSLNPSTGLVIPYG